ncbi:S41 family peptidase [Massilia sp. BJB1822]|uniref:S41 family peptidase n=1 Tax=Massilia sp. BJB1822 TaxID=2744470 RepID=UPI0015944024|nr:S41 family peptidase [Massilia sp. BJB1822]NVD97076.1 PDZ domain-containing protein [Massilia sp. BJB1822]
MLKLTPTAVLSAAALALLAGCGGGSSSGTPLPVDPPPVTPPPVNPPPVDPPPVDPPPPARLPNSLDYQHACVAPGTGSWERQGTLDDEKTWVRLWIDDTYLWYKEVPKPDPAAFRAAVDLFNVLKTPQLSASGRPKDRYHFSYPNATWAEMSRGVELGYGLAWARNADPAIPRTWRITTVLPGSAAALAGLRRGDQLLAVDGHDFVHGADAETVARLNAGLFPRAEREQHVLTLARDGVELSATLQSAKVDMAPVQAVKVLDAPDGKVGYLSFDQHNAVAERPLVDAFAELKAAAVGDLVLDLRYNGGGLLTIASQLAYMIAGPDNTAGHFFEQTLPNDKIKVDKPLEFLRKTMGLPAPKPVPAGRPLPTLGLKRVTILTGPGTCSASESVINGLRGADVDVTLIGGQTCGKPYAFLPTQNCGTTYFAIQYQGINSKGFGDYSDGFAPACKVADDFSRELGDPQEAQLAAALHYRAHGRCPVPQARQRAQAAPQPAMLPVRPEGSEISIYTPQQ